MKKSVAIIGGGIAGCAIARVLSKYDLDIHLIEKEADVGWGATKANTSIIHPGHEEDAAIHPLRAKFCVEGNRIWRKWAEEMDIPVSWPGELMIALDDGGMETLEHYLKLGEKNGVEGLEIMGREKIKKLEPNVNENAIAALWAPAAGLIEPWEACIALAENAVDNGVKVHLNTEVKGIAVGDGKITGLETNRGFMKVDVAINAAGLFADEISGMAGIDDFKIRPRRGQYYLFSDDAMPKVKRIVHMTPTEKTKGVYAVTTVEGNLMLGPTAEDLDFDEKEERSTTEEGLDYIWENARKFLASLPPRNKVSKMFAGLRPEPPGGKYLIEAYEEPWGFVNVAGIRSPGLTAAPSIAEYVAKLMEEKLDLRMAEKGRWNPFRKGMKRFSRLSDSEKQHLINRNPQYGNVVCMCKEVTEGEVVEAIERIRKLGAGITMDSIKFRTLAMFGECQGSFCRSRIASIISREAGIPLWQVSLKGNGTEYGIGDVKVLQRREKDEG